jgi:predicted Ser/Thr protein kinase
MEPAQRPLAAQDAEHWRRIREILDQALALPGKERAAYVERACKGDESGRAEVLSLLRAADQTAFLDKPLFSPQQDHAPAAGERLGHYEILSRLGQGGMGVVYKVTDTRLQRIAALKILSKADGSHEERTRFLHEARAASALNHPNIVTIYEYGSERDRDFIAMEFIEGQTLRQLLDGKLPLVTGIEYARQVANGLARAHSAGFVHRDLKPQNIMVTADGVAKILDFGLARRGASTTPSPEDSTTLTRVGSVVGTPSYMSPEQVLGEPVDARSDIFSFGIVLYEIACGKQPFRAGNPQATMHQIAAVDPPGAIEVNRAVPRGLAQLIDACLKKKPADRLQSMAEAAERLSSVGIDSGTVSRRYLLGAGMVLAAGAVGGVWYSQRPRSAVTPAIPVPERVLRCSLEAQQLRNGEPLGAPRVVSTAQVFEGPWRFRLRAAPEQAGYLYLVDEGLDQSGALQLAVLYPGEPLAAGQSFETKWYRLEGKPGTERLWIVWSKDEVRDFDQNDSKRIRAMLAGWNVSRQTKSSIELRGNTNVMAALLELQHR